MGLGLEIFAVDEQHSQLLLSACSDGDTWTLSPVEKFPEACGQQRPARRRSLWAVVGALALVFYVLVRAGTDVPPKPTCDDEPPALTKQKLALLEAVDGLSPASSIASFCFVRAGGSSSHGFFAVGGGGSVPARTST